MDLRLFEWLNGLAGRERLVDGVIAAVAAYGPYLLVAMFVGLWFWPAERSLRDRRERAAMLGAGSALLALGVDQLLARTWPRPRPFAHHAAVLLLPASHDPSFPSDHAAFAFAAAVALLLASRRLGVAGLTLAGLIALARVISGEHYPLDVVAGAVVGCAASLALWGARARLEPVLGLVVRNLRRLHLA